MKGPFQDLFDFSRKEQLGLIILVTIILGCLIVVNFHEYFFPRPTIEATAKEQKLIAALAELKGQEDSEYRKTETASSERGDLPAPFSFDPNELDLAGYIGLGFSEKQAQSIKNYFEKGGRVRSVEDFKKLYVVNDFMFERLRDYIQIETEEFDQFQVHQKSESIDKEPKSESPFAESSTTDTPLIVDLNSTNTDEFISLKGIGPVYAKRIISYGKLLGGYSSIDQLKEVYGLIDKPEVVESIRSQLRVDQSLIKGMDINSAEWKDLVRHPYIDEKVANSIINIRENHGPFQSVQELSRSHLIDDELLQKISPYLMVIE